ncbi:hypothetical protein Tco_1359412 [Tanacetum coccineum]
MNAGLANLMKASTSYAYLYMEEASPLNLLLPNDSLTADRSTTLTRPANPLRTNHSTSSPLSLPSGIVTSSRINRCFPVLIEDDSISPEIDDSYYDSEGDIRLLEEFLNNDPSSPLPPKELHVEELKIVKSSINDPPELGAQDHTFLS